MEQSSRMELSKYFKGQPPVRVYKLKSGDPRWPQHEHSHDYMQIWYVKKGACRHYVENGVYDMVESNLLIIPPDVSHSVTNASPDCIIYGCEFPIEIVLSDNIITSYKNSGEIFKFAYVESFESVINKTKACYVPDKSCQLSIERLFDSMFKAYADKQMFYEAELKADLLKMLVAISRDYRKSVPGKKQSESYRALITEAVKFIDGNFHEKIYIQDAASMSAMCISYFSYFFKEVTGKTFVEYLNSLRIEKAKQLLKDTDYSIDEISESTGFNSSTYFSRVFKAAENLSPGNYRLMLK